MLQLESFLVLRPVPDAGNLDGWCRLATNPVRDPIRPEENFANARVCKLANHSTSFWKRGEALGPGDEPLAEAVSGVRVVVADVADNFAQVRQRARRPDYLVNHESN